MQPAQFETEALNSATQQQQEPATKLAEIRCSLLLLHAPLEQQAASFIPNPGFTPAPTPAYALHTLVSMSPVPRKQPQCSLSMLCVLHAS